MSQDPHSNRLAHSLSDQVEVVLIVDDVPENLALLHASLDLVGYQVLIGRDGHAALEIAHRYLPDMILLDANMPALDGFETCVQLKSSPLTNPIPVIFMTAYSDTQSIVKGFEVGGVDYVTKPIQVDEVLARVKTHLAHAKVLRQQQQVIDASEIAVLAVDQEVRLLWQTNKAALLLQRYVNDQDGFSSGLKHWFAQMRQQPEQKAWHSCLYHGVQPLQLNLLSPYSVVQKNYLIQINPLEQTLSAAQISKRCSVLTQREAEVCHWLILGKTNKDIAEILQLSPRTVNKHLEHVFEKFNVENRTAAVAYINQQCVS